MCRNVHHSLDVHHGILILDHHVQGFGCLDNLDHILEQEVIRNGEGKAAVDMEDLLGRDGRNLRCSCLGENERHGDRAGKS